MRETNTIKKAINLSAAVAFWSTVIVALYANVLYQNLYSNKETLDI